MKRFAWTPAWEALLRRNSPYTRSPEYGSLVQLKGAIKGLLAIYDREAT